MTDKKYTNPEAQRVWEDHQRNKKFVRRLAVGTLVLIAIVVGIQLAQ